MSINTIGYEGANPADFLQTLKVAQVDMVVDVRERAQSRRAGFSKNALRSMLEGAGIAYVHVQQLGDPKEGRDAARANEVDKFKAIFLGVLETAAGQQALAGVIALSDSRSICLLCYERDHTRCHRKLISDKIESLTGRKARHLGVRQFEQAFERA